MSKALQGFIDNYQRGLIDAKKGNHKIDVDGVWHNMYYKKCVFINGYPMNRPSHIVLGADLAEYMDTNLTIKDFGNGWVVGFGYEIQMDNTRMQSFFIGRKSFANVEVRWGIVFPERFLYLLDEGLVWDKISHNVLAHFGERNTDNNRKTFRKVLFWIDQERKSMDVVFNKIRRDIKTCPISGKVQRIDNATGNTIIKVTDIYGRVKYE